MMIPGIGAKRTVSFVALFAGAIAAGCSSEDKGSAADSIVIRACATSSDCAPGTHCGPESTCMAECGAGKACAAGLLCSTADGRCLPGSVPQGGGTGIPTGQAANPGIPTNTSGAGGAGGGCAFSQAKFEQQTPNVMLVVDRSKSMEDEFGADSRWNTVRTALINPTDGFVTALETQIRFGLTMYTGPIMNGGGTPPGGGGMMPSGGSGGGGAGTGGQASTACPILVEVPIALNNYAQLSSVYQMTEPLGNTPTGESVAQIWPRIQALDPVLFPGPRVMVLATDGEPNSCGNTTNQQRGRQLSEDAIEAAYEAGIPTFVISVGDDVGEDHLRRIANLGQGFPVNDMNERFYPASDPSQLAEAFETIINGIRACVFDLNGTVNVGSASQGRVTLDGATLTYMDPNGWHLNGNGQVVVDGAACQSIQSGAQGIDIWFPCGAFIPE